MPICTVANPSSSGEWGSPSTSVKAWWRRCTATHCRGLIPVMIQVSTRQVKRKPGRMAMARCDSVRCKNTVVRNSATWDTSKPTTTATRIPGTFLRYPTYQVVDDQPGGALPGPVHLAYPPAHGHGSAAA